MEITYLLALITGRDVDLERLDPAELDRGWGAFHVEASQELASQLVEELEGWGGRRWKARFRLESSSSLSRKQRLAFELEIEGLDRRLARHETYQPTLIPNPNFNGYGFDTPFTVGGLPRDESPWLDLRHEAVRMAAVLSRFEEEAARKSAGPTGGHEADGVPEELLDGNAAAADRFKNNCTPGEKKALREFFDVCKRHGLTMQAPTTGHWVKAGEPGASEGTWRKQVSEGLRKALGPARQRKIEPTRSMISRSEFDGEAR